MRRYVPLLILISGCFLHSCKSRKGNAESTTEGVKAQPEAGGTFSDANTVMIPLPKQDLESPPTAQSTQATPLVAVKAPTGLNLADAPATTGGNLEEIAVECFTEDYDFIKPNWRFWAAIYRNGAVMSENDISIERCGDAQLSLLNLVSQKEVKYQVKAKLYYTSTGKAYNLSPKVIVWYEGQTNDFQSASPNQRLILRKLLLDQKVDVEVARTEKELCSDRGFLWTGYECLSQGIAFSFNYTDNAAFRNENIQQHDLNDLMCLDVNGNQAVIRKCKFTEQQNIFPEFRGYVLNITKKEDASEVESQLANGWYLFKVGGKKPGDSDQCLTAEELKKEHKFVKTKYTLKVKKCVATVAEDAARELKVDQINQMFFVWKATKDENAGRDAYRIVSMAGGFELSLAPDGTTTILTPGKNLCISVPYDSRSQIKVVPRVDDAEIWLSDCKAPDSPDLIKKTQYIRFDTQERFQAEKAKKK